MWGIVCAAKTRDAQGDDIRQHQLVQYPVVRELVSALDVFLFFSLLLLLAQTLTLFASCSPQRNSEGDTHTCRAYRQAVGVK